MSLFTNNTCNSSKKLKSFKYKNTFKLVGDHLFTLTSTQIILTSDLRMPRSNSKKSNCNHQILSTTITLAQTLTKINPIFICNWSLRHHCACFQRRADLKSQTTLHHAVKILKKNSILTKDFTTKKWHAIKLRYIVCMMSCFGAPSTAWEIFPTSIIDNMRPPIWRKLINRTDYNNQQYTVLHKFATIAFTEF